MIRTSFHLIGACYRDICTMVVIRRVARVSLQQLRFLISRQVYSDHWSLTLGSQHNPHLLLSAGAPDRCRSINGRPYAAPAAIDLYLLPAPALSSKSAARRCCCRSTDRQRRRRTDGRTLNHYIDHALHTMRAASIIIRVTSSQLPMYLCTQVVNENVCAVFWWRWMTRCCSCIPTKPRSSSARRQWRHRLVTSPARLLLT